MSEKSTRDYKTAWLSNDGRISPSQRLFHQSSVREMGPSCFTTKDANVVHKRSSLHVRLIFILSKPTYNAINFLPFVFLFTDALNQYFLKFK